MSETMQMRREYLQFDQEGAEAEYYSPIATHDHHQVLE